VLGSAHYGAGPMELQAMAAWQGDISSHRTTVWPTVDLGRRTSHDNSHWRAGDEADEVDQDMLRANYQLGRDDADHEAYVWRLQELRRFDASVGRLAWRRGMS
jgi:hypothetical protein